MYCDELGPVVGEMRDRQFLVINGSDGRFYTGRQKPCMVLIDCEVCDGVLTMKYVDGSSAKVRIDEVVLRNDIRTARLFNNELCEGLDCGDEVAAFLSEVLQEPDTRLLMHVKGLASNRACVITRTAWNEEIPLRTDKVTIEQFRPVILVDKCAAWDEDKWLSVHIGDVALQCLKPCLRLVLERRRGFRECDRTLTQLS
ncbi:unnamed protein product [Heligmosomoides polygyrus]|uniref:Tudor domain-containing protein n=1 Tax=Heligmosomoides polygyrus TaxID=6339 RepID=A0A183GPY6_HELPZ|nr:unnamed protein product [Heligmosomoides polygyrus]